MSSEQSVQARKHMRASNTSSRDSNKRPRLDDGQDETAQDESTTSGQIPAYAHDHRPDEVSVDLDPQDRSTEDEDDATSPPPFRAEREDVTYLRQLFGAMLPACRLIAKFEAQRASLQSDICALQRQKELDGCTDAGLEAKRKCLEKTLKKLTAEPETEWQLSASAKREVGTCREEIAELASKRHWLEDMVSKVLGTRRVRIVRLCNLAQEALVDAGLMAKGEGAGACAFSLHRGGRRMMGGSGRI